MATQNLNQIEDFSDLGQSFNFKYGEKTYTVPPISPVTAKKLIKTAREFSARSSERDERVKAFEESQKDLPEDQKKPVPSEMIEEVEGFFDFQVSFIILSGIKNSTFEDGANNIVTKDEIENSWSTQLVMRVFRRINEIISVEQEKKL